MHSREPCLDNCGKKQGYCSYCGSEGLCCTQNRTWFDISNGCDGFFGGIDVHECTLRPG